MWSIMRATAIVLGVVALILAALWFFQRRLIYLPDTSPVPAAPDVIAGAEDVALRTTDGLELGAWYVPSTAEEPRQVSVLVANGNGGNRWGRAPLAVELARAGFDVLLFDYRGYGGNEGSPSEDALQRDVRAAYGHLVGPRGVPPERIVYFGESLGAAIVVELATEHPPAALLLRSPFSSLEAAGNVHFPLLPVGWLLRDEFPVEALVAEINVPTTVAYGTADTIVPPEQSLAVAAAASGPVQLLALAGADHNDATMFTSAELIDAVAELADRFIAPPGPPGAENEDD